MGERCDRTGKKKRGRGKGEGERGWGEGERGGGKGFRGRRKVCGKKVETKREGTKREMGDQIGKGN